MTKPMMFRLAPAMLVATLGFPAIAAAQAVTPSTPTMTPPSREAPDGPVPTAPNVTPAPAPRSPASRAPASHAAAQRAPAKQADRVEARIAELRTKLKITPAQSLQWDAFANVMRDNARGMDSAFESRSSGRPKMNAVENMQSYSTLADQHAQDLRKLTPAFADLYNVMSDEQKRNADEVFRSSGVAGGPRRGR
jgi:protein CpxP